MPFAHGGEAGGPNLEALILAVPMVVVGIILFVQKSAKPIVSVLLVLGGITLALGGFTFLGTEDDHDAAASATTASYSKAVAGLCEAQGMLADGAPEAASDAFYDDAHIALHEIADRLATEDRAAGARLLESKQAVESGLEAAERSKDAPDLDRLQADLDDLIIATAKAVAEIDVAVGGCA